MISRTPSYEVDQASNTPELWEAGFRAKAAQYPTAQVASAAYRGVCRRFPCAPSTPFTRPSHLGG
jgi:hypothetical protein